MSTYDFFRKRFESNYVDALAFLVLAYNIKCKELNETTDEEKRYFLEGETANIREDILRIKKVAENLKIPLDNLNQIVETKTQELNDVISRS